MAEFPIEWETLSKLALRAHKLNLPATMPLSDVIARVLETDSETGEGAWSHSGVYLAEGTPLKFSYLDNRFDGVVQNGLLNFGEIGEESPSKAAVEAIRAQGLKAISLNGWILIMAEVSAGGARRWQKLSELRLLAQEGARRT